MLIWYVSLIGALLRKPRRLTVRTLVTGATGFVGRHLVSHLVESGDEVIAGYLGTKPVHATCEHVRLDVENAQAVSEALRVFRPDVVFHLAGMAFVPDAEANFERALLVNVNGTANVCRSAHLLGAGVTVLVVSSAEVYGKIQPTDLPLTEESAVQPATNYGLSKRMAELIVERYGRLGQIKAIVARPFNHIGAGQDPRFVVSNFAQQLQILKTLPAPRILEVGNLDSKRDFSDVRDIVRGYRLAAMKGSGTYNLGSGTSISIRKMVERMIELSGVEVEIRIDPSRQRASEVPEVFGSLRRAERDLGWRPQISLDDTLRWVLESARG
jgi:GDP-4-dehydro-6-deoxy-D-mannose reductase